LEKLFFQIVCNYYFFVCQSSNGYIFEPSLFQRLQIKRSPFQRLYFKCSISNGYMFSIYIYVWQFHFLNQFRHCVASSPLKMSRLSRLDSSFSSDDGDDDLEDTLTALHQAHTQYQALHAPRCGGSVPGRQYIHQDRESGHWRLYNDYFSENPTYGPPFFRRRFANSL